MKRVIAIALFSLLILAVNVSAYETVSIRQIQEVPIGRDSSLYEGDTVHVGGVVTGGTGLYYAGAGVSFYMEMPEGGPFSGIMSYSPNAEEIPTLIPGDSISFDCEVSEYGYPYDPPYTSNMTELFIVPGSFTFHSFGNPEPAPLEITAEPLDSTGGHRMHADSLGEQYEGVYVRIYEVTVDSVIVYTSTSTWVCHDTTGHTFCVREASDSISYLPTVGTHFASVSGVIYHRFDIYSVQPRYMRDIQFPSGAPIIGNVEYTPEHPFEDDQVTVSANVFDDVMVDDVRLFYRFNLGSWSSVHMTGDENNDYTFTLPVLPAGWRVDFYIEAEDDEGNIRKEPSEAPFNFYTYNILSPSAMTIAEAKVDADNNFVPDLVDSAAILTGIVTSINYSDTHTDFFMQDGEAGITVLDLFDLVAVSIGDSVTATGVISQYYGKTQLQVDSADRFVIGGTGVFDTLTMTCAELGDIVGEQYEGRLVKIMNVLITADPDPWPSLGSYATMTIEDATGSLALRIDSYTDIDGQNQPEGPQNIVGCLGQYTYSTPPNDGYQITPRMFVDFEDYNSIDEDDNLPRQTSLAQNYPNPFNPSTTVSFYLAKQGDVNLAIFDVLGQKVFEVNQRGVAAGDHNIVWNGVNFAGKSVSSGVYFYRLRSGDFSETKQMMLLK